MEENLAYLPSVSYPSASSSQDKLYYGYRFYGNSVDSAKQSSNYIKYGVLYNWPAAMNGASSSNTIPSRVQGACPDGWHLPSEAEWAILSDYLTSSGYGFEGSGTDIGKSMASVSGWVSSSNIGDVGNNQSRNNSSGFNAFPVGDRGYGEFTDSGSWATFWTSTRDIYTTEVWIHGLYKGSSCVRHNHDFEVSWLGHPVCCIKD